MENKEAASRIHISVENILDQVLYHIEFLKEIEELPELKSYKYQKLAAFRYEKFWLPLVAEHSKLDLVAPLDVQWWWHCHMLAPVSYSQDCTSLVGKVVNHTFRARGDQPICRDRARQLWSEKYMDEPFDIDETKDFAKYSADLAGFKSSLSYDIVSASERQSQFFYNVSLPHYRDRKFLENALIRYKEFLYINQKCPDAPLVPCFDIDLVWHTHMLNPVIYSRDTTQTCGQILNHDDTLTDRGPGSKLKVAVEKTGSAWNSVFEERYKLPGTLNRGKSTKGQLYETERNEILQNEVMVKGTIRIERITLSGTFLTKKQLDSMFLCCKSNTFCSKESIFEGNDAVLNYNAGESEFSASWPAQNMVIEIDKDGSAIPSVRFELWKRKSLGCFRRRDENIFKRMVHFETSRFRGGSDTFTLRENINLFTLQISATVVAKVPRIDLFIKEGQFSVVETAAEVRRVFPDKTEDYEISPFLKTTCITAYHRLVNEAIDSELSVRVFHCAPLMTSRIQVLSGAHVAVVCDLISSDQLPLQTQRGMVFQVEGDIPTLDPYKGERAVLIKNNTGDWAKVVGGWVDYKPGKPDKTVQRCIVNDRGEEIVQELVEKGKIGEHGHLAYRIYGLQSAEKFTGLPANLDVNFECGTIQVHAEFEHVAEYVALSFSVALLQVLCVPRCRYRKEGDEQSYGCEAYFPHGKLMVAAGLHRMTPSNYYITKQMGENTCLTCGMEDHERFNNTIDMKLKMRNTDLGFDGCGCNTFWCSTSNLEAAECTEIKVSEKDAMWKTVGRKDGDGSIIPIKKCGRFATMCSCDVCEPKPPERSGCPPNCRCRCCSCGGMCMHTVSPMR